MINIVTIFDRFVKKKIRKVWKDEDNRDTMEKLKKVLGK